MKQRSFRRVCGGLIVTAAVVLFGACDVISEPVPSSPVNEATMAAARYDSRELDRVAEQLALALSLPEVRTQLLEDMRDSPFPNTSFTFTVTCKVLVAGNSHGKLDGVLHKPEPWFTAS